MKPTKNQIEIGKYMLYLITRITIFNRIVMRTRMISRFCKRTISSIVITLFLILLPRITFSATTAQHTVTVIVNAITIIQISVGTINLNIPGGVTAVVVAGQDQMTVTDNTSKLLWGTNSSPRKITIITNLVTQKFTLQALAMSPTVGTAASAATLSTTASDFITNIARSSGSATVQYTGIALASKGTGTDSHTITFTITTQ